jgi:basic membrane protein A
MEEGMRQISRVLVGLFALVFAVAAAGPLFAGGQGEDGSQSEGGEQAEEQTQVAVVFATGGLGDQSFNDAAYRGLEQAQEELGVSFDFAEPDAIADYQSFLNQFASSGQYDLIISIGFDQADALSEVASQHSDQDFAIVDAVVEAENVASYVYKEKERGFLMGVAAAMTTTMSGDQFINSAPRIGVIGGMKIPLIDANIAGYIAGAHFVSENVEVTHSYVGGWGDPARGKELAISMIEDDVDVIWAAAGRSGLGVIDAAQENDIYAIGADSDQGHVAPDHILTNGMKFVDQTVFRAIQQVEDGTFETGVQALGVAEGGLGFTESLLDSDVVSRLEEVEDMIANGEIEIPETIEAARSN